MEGEHLTISTVEAEYSKTVPNAGLSFHPIETGLEADLPNGGTNTYRQSRPG